MTSTFDPIASLRAYHTARNARMARCNGGLVSQVEGYYLWYCDSCGLEFGSREQAARIHHTADDEQEEAQETRIRSWLRSADHRELDHALDDGNDLSAAERKFVLDRLSKMERGA